MFRTLVAFVLFISVVVGQLYQRGYFPPRPYAFNPQSYTQNEYSQGGYNQAQQQQRGAQQRGYEEQQAQRQRGYEEQQRGESPSAEAPRNNMPQQRGFQPTQGYGQQNFQLYLQQQQQQQQSRLTTPSAQRWDFNQDNSNDNVSHRSSSSRNHAAQGYFPKFKKSNKIRLFEN